MDFQEVSSTLVRDFEKEGIHYALIGGFALGFWGAARATVDMDFLLLVEDKEAVEDILSSYNYQCIQKSENVGQYVAETANYGSVDFIYAARNISRKMLERSVEIEFGTDQKIRVLLPEDIIGLKIQALSNDPSREVKDYADIDALIKARQTGDRKIDWQVLSEYFELFDKLNLYTALKEKYDASN